jgi:hypothetical protein
VVVDGGLVVVNYNVYDAGNGTVCRGAVIVWGGGFLYRITEFFRIYRILCAMGLGLLPAALLTTERTEFTEMG